MMHKYKPDGTYKRTIPANAFPCQDADLLSGHHPHWVKCDRYNNADMYHFQSFDALEVKNDGTYELCGEKLDGNPEYIIGHKLIKHGQDVSTIEERSFERLRKFLLEKDIEGIVFSSREKMCKIRKSEFGIKR